MQMAPPSLLSLPWLSLPLKAERPPIRDSDVILSAMQLASMQGVARQDYTENEADLPVQRTNQVNYGVKF